MKSDLPLLVQGVAALGPLLLLGGALTAAFLVWNSGRRDRWWVRAQWAMDRTHGSSDDEQEVGLAVLYALLERAPSKDERLIVLNIADLFLERFETLAEQGAKYLLGEEGSDGEEEQEHVDQA